MINDDQVRAFIAIELPDEMKSGLKAVEQRFTGPETRCAKWVNPFSIHLTLKFLGNVKVSLLDQVKRTVEADTASCGSFTLKTAGLGCFPNIHKPRVFWLGLEGDIEKLQYLQRKIETSMKGLGSLWKTGHSLRT